jgi:hypothetical protein
MYPNNKTTKNINKYITFCNLLIIASNAILFVLIEFPDKPIFDKV